MLRLLGTRSFLACGRATLNENKTLRPVSPKLTEPWQAEVLALSIALQEMGHYSPAEWATILAAEIEKARVAGDPADGSTYYSHVLAALERIVAENALVPSEALQQRRTDWEDAYRRTPHGQPVTLPEDPATG
nr:nitrile hydratase accessory protein [Ruegeria atlantica]